MAKATAKETSKRIDHLQQMIMEGEPSTVCVQYALGHWGLSRSQSYRLIKRAWCQIHDDVEGSDLERKEMLAWAVQTLMSAAGQAKRQNNPGAVVACIRQLDRMTGLGMNSTAGHRVHRSRF